MIALAKILIGTLISFFCAVTGLNLDVSEKSEHNVKITSCSDFDYFGQKEVGPKTSKWI